MKTLKYLVFLTLLWTAIACNPQKDQSPSKSDSIALAERKKKALDYFASIDSIKEAVKPKWIVSSFVDNFGDPTKEKYLSYETSGTFSNSATANSPLFVKILITKKSCGVFLHEYKESGPAVKPIGTYTFNLKNADGKTHQVFSGSEWNQSGGISISNFIYENIKDYDFSELRNFMVKSNGQVKFYIKDSYSSSYNFTIDTNGLSDRLKELK